MNKLIGWIVSFTKVGAVVKTIQNFLDGKKQYLAGVSMTLPALLTMVQKFQEGGIQYLLGSTHSPEYLALVAGIAIIANAAKGEKIRNENAVIIDQNQQLLDKPAVVVVPATAPVSSDPSKT